MPPQPNRLLRIWTSSQAVSSPQRTFNDAVPLTAAGNVVNAERSDGRSALIADDGEDARYAERIPTPKV